jgi:short-subunit dehydrogenase
MELSSRRALVTGASSGIGAVFAEQLAAAGADLVLVARRAEALDEVAARLADRHGVDVVTIPADLAQAGAARRLAGEVAARGLQIDVLVNNAGFATHGAFVEADAPRMGQEIALNVGCVVELTHELVPGMVERGYGAVVNVASTAAFQPVPFMAVYGATKSFVLAFSEALWGELSDKGVAVLALCPGATETEFFEVAGEAASVGTRQTPEQVVATALRALHRNTPPPSVVSGRANALAALLPRLVTRRAAIRITRRLMSPAA